MCVAHTPADTTSQQAASSPSASLCSDAGLSTAAMAVSSSTWWMARTRSGKVSLCGTPSPVTTWCSAILTRCRTHLGGSLCSGRLQPPCGMPRWRPFPSGVCEHLIQLQRWHQCGYGMGIYTPPRLLHGAHRLLCRYNMAVGDPRSRGNERPLLETKFTSCSAQVPEFSSMIWENDA